MKGCAFVGLAIVALLASVMFLMGGWSMLGGWLLWSLALAAALPASALVLFALDKVLNRPRRD